MNIGKALKMLPSAWRVLINRQVFPEPISGLEHFGVLGMSQRVKQANACSLLQQGQCWAGGDGGSAASLLQIGVTGRPSCHWVCSSPFGSFCLLGPMPLGHQVQNMIKKLLASASLFYLSDVGVGHSVPHSLPFDHVLVLSLKTRFVASFWKSTM